MTVTTYPLTLQALIAEFADLVDGITADAVDREDLAGFPAHLDHAAGVVQNFPLEYLHEDADDLSAAAAYLGDVVSGCAEEGLEQRLLEFAREHLNRIDATNYL